MRNLSVLTMVVVFVLFAAACSSTSSDSGAVSSASGEPSTAAGESSNAPSESESDPTPASDPAPASNAGASDAQSGDLAGPDENTDEILVDLPPGWEITTQDINDVRLYHIAHTSNADTEAALIAEYPDAELESPFFGLRDERVPPILGLSGFGPRADERLLDLGNIVMVLSEAPKVDGAPWGEGWDEDVLAEYADFNWRTSGLDVIESEIAGGPALSFNAKDGLTGLTNLTRTFVVLTPGSQLLRLEIYPSDSVHADDIAGIIASIRKGARGANFAN